MIQILYIDEYSGVSCVHMKDFGRLIEQERWFSISHRYFVCRKEEGGGSASLITPISLLVYSFCSSIFVPEIQMSTLVNAYSV